MEKIKVKIYKLNKNEFFKEVVFWKVIIQKFWLPKLKLFYKL